MIVLIPAYEPDQSLVTLVAELRGAVAHRGHHPTLTAPPPDVVVVDDGSGPAYSSTFAQAAASGATVLTHRVSRGKGAALRTGLAHIRDTYPGQDVVCADSDGQHLVADIRQVADRVATRRPGEQGAIVLGSRSFGGAVPTRSRFGNEATRWFVRIASGLRVRDTQSGLRGYSAELIDWLLGVPGDRFEYEMTVLLRAHAERRPIVEVPIATVYLDGNAGTHFRPLVDSARVYAPLLRFVASSALAGVLDVVGLLILMAWTGNLLASVVGARLLSSTVNFLVNRRAVFDSQAPLGRSAARYAALAITLVAANYALLWSLLVLGLPLLLAKVCTELVLYVASYAVQNRVVFGHHRDVGMPARDAPALPVAERTAA